VTNPLAYYRNEIINTVNTFKSVGPCLKHGTVLYSKCKLLTLFSNIRLVWKVLIVTNALAYYTKELI
jgi:hypothetical protein